MRSVKAAVAAFVSAAAGVAFPLSAHAATPMGVHAASNQCIYNAVIQRVATGRYVGPNANYPHDPLQASLSYPVGSSYYTVCFYSSGYLTIESTWNGDYVGENTQYYSNLTPTLPGVYLSGEFDWGCEAELGAGPAVLLTDVATGDPVGVNSGGFVQGGDAEEAFWVIANNDYWC